MDGFETRREMMNRFKSFSSFFVVFLLLFLNTNVFAANSNRFKVYPSQTIDSLQKGWIFEFNNEINPITVNSNNIYIEDRNGQRVELDLGVANYNNKSNVLIIYPNKPYRNFCEYTLFIDRNLESVDGEALDMPIKLSFKVEVSKKNIPTSIKKLIKESLLDSDRELDLSDYKIDYKDIRLLVDEVLDESPEIFHYDHYKIYFDPDTKYTNFVKLYYSESSSTQDREREKLLNTVRTIVSARKNSSSDDIQVISSLYDFVLSTARYWPETDNSVNAYGTLIEGRACCSGYAKALQILLQEAGYETELVKGYGKQEAHIWLKAKINETWYHFDPSWDDSSNSPVRNYFMLSEESILKDHTIVTDANTVFEVHEDDGLHYIKNLKIDFYDKGKESDEDDK